MSEWEFISGAFKNPHKRTRCTLMHLQAKKDKKLHNKYSPQKLSENHRWHKHTQWLCVQLTRMVKNQFYRSAHRHDIFIIILCQPCARIDVAHSNSHYTSASQPHQRMRRFTGLLRSEISINFAQESASTVPSKMLEPLRKTCTMSDCLAFHHVSVFRGTVAS